MKKILYLLLFIFVSFGYSQNIDINDANLEENICENKINDYYIE